MKHLDLFSGIGGFALAAETIWPEATHTFVEKDPFCQAVLRKHWPDAKYHDDIKTFPGSPADIVTGGFPCQPFSSAGKRKGSEDDRHLWPEMLRVIGASAPEWVIGENVGGLLTWDGGMVFEQVLSDLEAIGYEAWPFVIPACAVGAPHRRDRVWIIAHAIGRDAGRTAGSDASESIAEGLRQRNAMEQLGKPDSLRVSPDPDSADGIGGGIAGIPDRKRMEKDQQEGPGSRSEPARRYQDGWSEDWTQAATRLCTLDDGLPGGLVRPKGWRNAALKTAGNAIVPQVAMKLMEAIKQASLVK